MWYSWVCAIDPTLARAMAMYKGVELWPSLPVGHCCTKINLLSTRHPTNQVATSSNEGGSALLGQSDTLSSERPYTACFVLSSRLIAGSFVLRAGFFLVPALFWVALMFLSSGRLSVLTARSLLYHTKYHKIKHKIIGRGRATTPCSRAQPVRHENVEAVSIWGATADRSTRDGQHEQAWERTTKQSGLSNHHDKRDLPPPMPQGESTQSSPPIW
jgi:hypothetical protein